MSEEYLVRHCAPTLAGLKTGSIFLCPFEDAEGLRDFLRRVNCRLGAKGLRALPLRVTGQKALVYIFRPKMLTCDLSCDAAAELLRQHGYDPGNCQKCVAQLCRRVQSQPEFPHEIGLFLGYPPEDVAGFIENRACDSKCTGCWKVYGDEDAARKKFALYKKCTRVYRNCWANGSDIQRLTVAC